MRDAPWLAKAKTLAAGQSTRITCCSDDKSMLVSNTRRGFTGYCFRCREPLFEAHGQFSIAMLQQRRAELELVSTKEVKLPDDFVDDVPAEHMVWLYKAGIDGPLAKAYGVGYSKRLDRVILPVYHQGELVAYTARSLYGKPKYIEKAVDGDQVFCANPALRLPSYADFAGPDLVFTEDNLSAIRVGRVARHCVSLMGTSCNAVQLDRAFSRCGLQRYRALDIAVWLDGDDAGVAASRSICNSLRLRGYNVHEVRTEKDPKFQSNWQIREALST